jgi:hypothetical protein
MKSKKGFYKIYTYLQDFFLAKFVRLGGLAILQKRTEPSLATGQGAK